MSRVPDGVRLEEGELAAGLCDLADLGLKMSLKGKHLCMDGLVKLLQTQSIICMYVFALPVGSGSDRDFLPKNC